MITSEQLDRAQRPKVGDMFRRDLKSVTVIEETTVASCAPMNKTIRIGMKLFTSLRAQFMLRGACCVLLC